MKALRPRESLQLGDDVVDEDGRAIEIPEIIVPAYGDKDKNENVTPWESSDIPPSPPPKGHRTFAPKLSFPSLRTASQSSLAYYSSRGSESQSIHSDDSHFMVPQPVPDEPFLSPDSPPKLRKAKSSLNPIRPLNNLISRKRSKSRIRAESESAEHPSLLPPPPSLPDHVVSFLPIRPSSPPHPSLIKEAKKHNRRKKDSHLQNHSSLSHPEDDQIMTLDTDLARMEGIVDSQTWSSSIGASGSTSPSSAPDSSSYTRSLSDRSSSLHPTLPPILPSEFHNPFTTTTIPPPRTSSLQHGMTERKISPKTKSPEQPRKSLNQSPKLQPNGQVKTNGNDTGDGSWVAPESWSVQPPENAEEDGEYSSSEDSNSILQNTPGYGSKAPLAFLLLPNQSFDGSLHGHAPVLQTHRGDINGHHTNVFNEMGQLYGGSFSTLSFDRATDVSSLAKSLPLNGTGGKGDTVSTRGSVSSKASTKYALRIYRPNNTYHVVSCGFPATVDLLISELNKKLLFDDKIAHRLHRLYLKENGRERILGQTERPAEIVRRRLEMAGYDLTDGMELLAQEGFSFLLKFVYKSQLLGPAEKPLAIENYERIDLSARGLRTIPPSLYEKADQITTLYLSRNPMLDIPLDFIQACTTLIELRLSHMAMKKVPRSVRYCTMLNRLDISCNRIADLDEAYLENITGLKTLLAQNNRMEKLPWHFPRLQSLVYLNISNNKFKVLPGVVCELENLRDLDISFNMITELPDEIGMLKNLEHLIIIGNLVQRFPDECSNLINLRRVDCSRNAITDATVIIMLPKLEKLRADRNNLHALPLCLGPKLSTIDAPHNDITQISLVPGLIGPGSFSLSLLDISHAKLSSLDDAAIAELSSLRILRVDHNELKVLPESIGKLEELETLSCSYNNLEDLPSSIGQLQKLQALDIHNNSLTELPITLWNCASLAHINATSNMLSTPWQCPPSFIPTSPPPVASSDSYSSPLQYSERKGSAASLSNGTPPLPPLACKLERLYLGENQYTDDTVVPLMIFRELKVLNLSFNEIQDLPSSFFKSFSKLEELYLSGNKLTSIPTEDLPKLTHLSTLYLNGNRLQTLPQELGKVKSLTILDVGSNLLKYNISNWEFDWNWNFNKNLKYLNLSGNKRLQIKSDTKLSGGHRYSRISPAMPQQSLAGFTELSQLRVLGLMDVTITTTGMNASVDIPDEHEDRRVRTSESTVLGMPYGIADTLGKNDFLSMIDLVHEFPASDNQTGKALFAMFGRSRPPKSQPPGVSGNRIAKYLHDKYVEVFKTYLESLKPGEGVSDALRRSFLKINQNLHDSLFSGRKQSHTSGSNVMDNHATYLSRGGASGVVLYFSGKKMFVANAGNALAVVSKNGVAHCVSRKHEPYNQHETVRIRTAEGWISSDGLVNDEVDVSRSFGFFHLPYVINARPDIFEWDLSGADEFVIVGNRGLWDYVSYQTAVDIARREKGDPMIAAQKLRDFALSYGADGTTMIMVISVADQGSLADTQVFRQQRPKDPIVDRSVRRLQDEVPAPVGHLALVFTDIRNSTHLWEANRGMNTAWRRHNSLLRRRLRLCGGYEVKTEGDAFMCAFPTTLAAVWWCLSVQMELLEEPWPLEILECEDGKPIADPEGRIIAQGISVRMGIHCGSPLCERDPVNHRMDYFGPMVNRAARINGSAAGGQIMCSAEVMREINAKISETGPLTPYSDDQTDEAIEAIRQIGIASFRIGELKLKGLELPEMVTAIYPKALAHRHQLEETVAEPTDVEGSRVQFSVTQIRHLGLICLRLESLASSRIFREVSERKASIISEHEPEEEEDSLYLYGDPSLLLPALSEKSSERDVMLALDSLSGRIENAAAKLREKSVKDSLVSILKQRGGLDQRTLQSILHILDGL
ncbi:hypothetical protein K435DRAFT_716145 [Dendrothele bispora CBS 962.96]|uniref:Adenylate cyclase n=1 Tax=Dendrothele bispora (strain CBS 962.96) TaxID=1314807 RepID=A0A4S8MJZ7_DENBC|nr:hypothetical protein K435DRAFT_716145 [Dendrothele bispora CBS 962.96]